VTNNGNTQGDGINPGDVVANSSFEKLQDNSPVAIADASGAGKGPHAGGKEGGKHSGGKDSGGKKPDGNGGNGAP
jgi:hypothetical protein